MLRNFQVFPSKDTLKMVWCMVKRMKRVLTPRGRGHDEAGYHVVGDDGRVAGRRRAHQRIDDVVRGRAHRAAQLRRLRARRPAARSPPQHYCFYC